MRKCMGCAEHFPKMELIRVLRTPDGAIVLDATGKKSGRGAYICNDPACLKKAKKARRLETSLECEIPEEVFLRLEEELSGATGS
ncbi:MAG: YlxR family protein [Clostridia bacterium]|nr:YlxR family protein [Clostridia bacterium]